jgi:hypothetical protein
MKSGSIPAQRYKNNILRVRQSDLDLFISRTSKCVLTKKNPSSKSEENGDDQRNDGHSNPTE